MLKRTAIWPILMCTACLLVGGCARKEEPKQKTPDQIRAEIQKVESDPKMPANAKGMVLGLLHRELQQAEKRAQDRR
ncbi:MAG: hypothetical protein GX446_06000 [Chthonomonadales bacterium]|nr:hypothetical protein [Chthonomonadales bacterium]